MLTFLLWYVMTLHTLGVLFDAAGDATIGVKSIAILVHMVPVVLASILLYNV